MAGLIRIQTVWRADGNPGSKQCVLLALCVPYCLPVCWNKYVMTATRCRLHFQMHFFESGRIKFFNYVWLQTALVKNMCWQYSMGNDMRRSRSFLVHQLILQFYRGCPMVISKKTIISQGFRGVPTFSRGVQLFPEGDQMLISIETHIICDFPGWVGGWGGGGGGGGGGGSGPPIPLLIHTRMIFLNLYKLNDNILQNVYTIHIDPDKEVLWA